MDKVISIPQHEWDSLFSSIEQRIQALDTRALGAQVPTDPHAEIDFLKKLRGTLEQGALAATAEKDALAKEFEDQLNQTQDKITQLYALEQQEELVHNWHTYGPKDDQRLDAPEELVLSRKYKTGQLLESDFQAAARLTQWQFFEQSADGLLVSDKGAQYLEKHHLL